MASVDERAELKSKIRAIYDRHKGRCGYRAITAALRQPGDLINHQAVQPLMVTMGLHWLVGAKKYQSYRGAQGAMALHALARDFSAAPPHQKWVTDVTAFKLANAKLYLSPVMDLFNGEIVAYQTGAWSVLARVKTLLSKVFRRL